MPEIRHFKKKPIPVPMLEWTGDNWTQMQEFVGFIHDPGESPVRKFYFSPGGAKVYNTEERIWISVPIGHFVAKGVRNEFYPISPAVLEKTYDEVSDVEDR